MFRAVLLVASIFLSVLLAPNAHAEPDPIARMITSPLKRAAAVRAEAQRNAEMTDAVSADPQQSTKTTDLAALKRRHAELEVQRANLDTTDPAAVRKFNEAVAEYTAELTHTRTR